MKIKRREILKHTKKYILKAKKEIVFLSVASLIAIPTAFISPYFVKYFIDNILYAGEISAFAVVVAGMFFAYGVRFITDLISLYCSNKILNRFRYYLRRDIWKNFFRMSVGEFEAKQTGDLKMRIYDDVESLGNFINDQVVSYIYNVLIVIVSLVASFYINYKLTLYGLIIIPVVFLTNTFIGRGVKKVNEEIRAVNEGYYTFEHNALQYWKEIKTHNSQASFINRFKEYRKMLAKLGYKQIRYWLYTEVFNELKTNFLTQALIFIIGASLVFTGKMTLGTLVMLSAFFGLAVTSLDEISGKNILLKTNRPYYKRIIEVLNYPVDLSGGKTKKAFAFNDCIEFKNVSFKYPGTRNTVLDNFNLKINKNDKAAVTGQSGIGKSTLIKLILNCYPADEGEITYDQINVNDINKKDLYRNIGVVMQDAYLFNDTIKANLLMANKYAHDEEINTACKAASIYDFIMSLPQGFETMIGERGVKLSGGQKQRLLIAQALLKKPEMIVLDEATSHVDKHSEKKIYRSLTDLNEEITIIAVAHNLSGEMRENRKVILKNNENEKIYE